MAVQYPATVTAGKELAGPGKTAEWRGLSQGPKSRQRGILGNEDPLYSPLTLQPPFGARRTSESSGTSEGTLATVHASQLNRGGEQGGECTGWTEHVQHG